VKKYKKVLSKGFKNLEVFHESKMWETVKKIKDDSWINLEVDRSPGSRHLPLDVGPNNLFFSRILSRRPSE